MSNVPLHIGRADESSRLDEVENNADGRTCDTPPIPPRIINLSGLLDVIHVCPAVAAPRCSDLAITRSTKTATWD